MSGRGHQLIHSDALSAELEALGLDSSLFGAAGIPAPIFQALVPRRAGVFDEHANAFGTADEPASFTRASPGLHRNAAGAWTSAAANAIRPEHDASGNFLGYLFEGPGQNEFLNSAAAATQDISLGTGTFTCSVHGTGSVTSSNGTGTASGHGAATDGAPNTIVVSGAGTITYTVSGSPTYVQVEEMAVPSSPIITAGTAAPRAIDALSWGDTPAGFAQAAGFFLCDVSFPFIPSNIAAPAHVSYWVSPFSFRSASAFGLCALHPSNAVTGKVKLQAATTLGTNASVTTAAVVAAYDVLRCATRWETGGDHQCGVFHNGSWLWGTPQSFPGYDDGSTLAVGLDQVIPALYSRARLFNRVLSTAEIERLFSS